MVAELHIASCVAYVQPDLAEGVARQIAAAGLAEVPRSHPQGRLVILIEERTSARVVDAIEAIRALPGVLAVHLAYQHAEPETDLEETP